ncbi:MAG TPA: GMC family oxidoreductase [Steroidobacteraceae bacterium]|jgi:choline dehydrogenase-like flavoprotein|nr:GMC family oxidoreductase [Steroidobacteraceae bacterium]
MAQLASLDALNASEQYDVCIIGSGPAGTTLATTLARRGIRTLLLESGRGLRSWLTDAQLKGLARYEFTGDTDYPLTQTASRLLGGNSNFWTGRCERLHPSDFEPHPYTPADNPWPIRYSDLAPYYEAAEQMLRVRGGPRTRFAPPRTGPLPLPGSPDITLLTQLCAQFGVEVEDSATATPTKTWRFFNVQKEILPNFLSSGHGTLLTGATVTNLVAAQQRIVAADVKTLDGHGATARARIFVVCCGGFETPRLLQLSAAEAFPNGIGNAHDMVGRGFNEHPNVGLSAHIPHNRLTLTPTNKIARTHQFYQTFRSEGLGAIVPVFRQSWLMPNHLLRFQLSAIPTTLLSLFKRVVNAPIHFGSSIEMKISPANRVALSKTRTDAFGRPVAQLIFHYSDEDRALIERARALLRGWLQQLRATDIEDIGITWSRHLQGACRMGDNPRSSVVDRDLKVHEAPNLYLCGSEVFVTGGGMQPTLTIAALALRLADTLTQRLSRSGQ